MRIVLIGVSHWHTPFYLDPVMTMPDKTVIGVSDPAIVITNSALNGCCTARPPVADRCSISACTSSIFCRGLLPGTKLQVVGSMMSNHLARLDIEDHAVVLIRGGGATCVVETGYLYPAPNSVFDLHYSIRTEGHHFAARDNQTLEILDNDRHRELRSMPLTNSFFYPTFVADTLRRLERGEKPIADLTDMAEAMDLVEAAYALSPVLTT
jgi:hypothetical protein